MSILEHEVRPAFDAAATGQQRYLYTRDEYAVVASTGVFDGRRVELIEGEIIEMSPIGDVHAAVPDPLVLALHAAFGPGVTVRNQMPIQLGEDRRPSEPQPDIAVVGGSWRDYLSRKPGPADVKLIVEVADSSLSYDRNVKAVLYAAAGIPEYWILNVAEGTVEVYREPAESGYRITTVHKANETIAPLLARDPVILAEFMP